MRIKAPDIASLNDRTFAILKWTLSTLSAAATFALIQVLDFGLI